MPYCNILVQVAVAVDLVVVVVKPVVVGATEVATVVVVDMEVVVEATAIIMETSEGLGKLYVVSNCQSCQVAVESFYFVKTIAQLNK